MTIDDDTLNRSKTYLDELFGEGAGERHTAFIDRIAHPELRDTLHRYHAMESDTAHLTVEENYLIGMAVLLALRSYGPASMFAKTLLHRGVGEKKIMEVVARLSMWIGGVPAAEAAAHVQKAIGEHRQLGFESMAAWFPENEDG
jgi:alkylhydroperoxidase/carboxymuconolactone decarboxylase family protein YurZ